MTKNRSEIVSLIAKKINMSQASVNKVFSELFVIMEESIIEGDKLTVPGWFSLEKIARAARPGRNPQTGELIHIAAGYGVRFTPGSKLKAAAKKSKNIKN